VSKLLVIDDERPILDVLEMSLAGEGYQVRTAESGQEGLRIFEEFGPKVVLTDIKMPGIDGIEVLKRIKALDNEAEVIVITGHGDMDSAIAALQHGASDFINKPIRNEVLTLALDRAEKKLEMNRRLRDYTENLEQKVEECTTELKEAQEELLRSERLATIGETVAGLAHYIKNILSGLRGGLYMVNTGVAKKNHRMFKEGASMVERNVERISDLALDLLSYSKERAPERSICKPNEIVEEAVEIFKKKARENHVTLKTDLAPDLGTAHLDRNGIYNVMLNLVSNAIDACIYDEDTSKTWEVAVQTRLETNGDAGKAILFRVRDNGSGMTEEVRKKLFTKFFSTKAGRGTGLGLLITQKIIHEHGGTISVDSEAGQGTVFSARIPKGMPEKAPESGSSRPGEVQ
jgi:signal transduction histidine kinase